MQLSINLLPVIGEESGKKKQLIRKINLGITVFLVVTLVVVIGVFIFRSQGIATRNVIEKDIQTQEALVDKQQENEMYLKVLKQRLLSGGKILGERKSYATFFSNLEKVIPADLTISDISIGIEGIITINGQTTSYSKLAGFVLILVDQAKEESSPGAVRVKAEPKFTNVNLNMVSHDEATNTVRFTISCQATKGAFL